MTVGTNVGKILWTFKMTHSST